MEEHGPLSLWPWTANAPSSSLPLLPPPFPNPAARRTSKAATNRTPQLEAQPDPSARSRTPRAVAPLASAPRSAAGSEPGASR